MTNGSYSDVPVPGQLFTWVDVDQYFEQLAMLDLWPDWLSEVSGYWDSVEFRVRSGANDGHVKAWAVSSGECTTGIHQ